MTDQPDSRDVEILPCPFCETELRHVESWARSFDPPRLYHEYHHDNADCILASKRWFFTDEPSSRVAFFAAWNTRAALATTAARVAELEAALRAIVEVCANTGSGNAIVAERVIDRCDDLARAALAH